MKLSTYISFVKLDQSSHKRLVRAGLSVGRKSNTVYDDDEFCVLGDIDVGNLSVNDLADILAALGEKDITISDGKIVVGLPEIQPLVDEITFWGHTEADSTVIQNANAFDKPELH